MTKREQYQISFQRQLTPRNKIYHFATTNNLVNVDIAEHLSNSDKIDTVAQLKVIDKEQSSPGPDFFWGEVFGSSVYFHSNGNVKLGDVGTTLPIQDFKELLQEWLVFINL